VIAFAQKTGDYSVLSKPDLAVLALTLALEEEYKASQASRAVHEKEERDEDEVEQDKQVQVEEEKDEEEEKKTVPRVMKNAWGLNKGTEETVDQDEKKDDTMEDAFPSLPSSSTQPIGSTPSSSLPAPSVPDLSSLSLEPTPQEKAEQDRIAQLRRGMERETARQFEQVYEDDENWEQEGIQSSDEEAGEWITPGNVNSHKAVDLGLIPVQSTSSLPGQTIPSVQNSTNALGDSPSAPVELSKTQKRRLARRKREERQVPVACYTGDYAVQNVLVQMGLGLVGEGGKRIKSVKSWVLRCHACFK
jgi:RNA-binding protein NOB1